MVSYSFCAGTSRPQAVDKGRGHEVLHCFNGKYGSLNYCFVKCFCRYSLELTVFFLVQVNRHGFGDFATIIICLNFPHVLIRTGFQSLQINLNNAELHPRWRVREPAYLICRTQLSTLIHNFVPTEFHFKVSSFLYKIQSILTKTYSLKYGTSTY